MFTFDLLKIKSCKQRSLINFGNSIYNLNNRVTRLNILIYSFIGAQITIFIVPIYYNTRIRLINFLVLQKTTYYNIHGGQLEMKASM